MGTQDRRFAQAQRPQGTMHATPATVVPGLMRVSTMVACLLIAAAGVAGMPSSARAACSNEPPSMPEVVILDTPELSPLVARVPLRTREVNGEVRLQNVYGTPEIIKPRLRPVLEARSVAGNGETCWRLARVEVRLEVEASRLEVPEEFAGNACLYIGALVSALEDHDLIHASMRAFWQRVTPRLSQRLGEFQPAVAKDEGAAAQAFNTWLRPRLLGIVEALHAEDGGPRPPPQDAGFEAGQRACPTFLEELTRFKAARQPGGGRTPI